MVQAVVAVNPLAAPTTRKSPRSLLISGFLMVARLPWYDLMRDIEFAYSRILCLDITIIGWDLTVKIRGVASRAVAVHKKSQRVFEGRFRGRRWRACL
jgi:hypothetical protein